MLTLYLNMEKLIFNYAKKRNGKFTNPWRTCSTMVMDTYGKIIKGH